MSLSTMPVLRVSDKVNIVLGGTGLGILLLLYLGLDIWHRGFGLVRDLGSLLL